MSSSLSFLYVHVHSLLHRFGQSTGAPGGMVAPRTRFITQSYGCLVFAEHFFKIHVLWWDGARSWGAEFDMGLHSVNMGVMGDCLLGMQILPVSFLTISLGALCVVLPSPG